jgi:hypothetical protein
LETESPPVHLLILPFHHPPIRLFNGGSCCRFGVNDGVLLSLLSDVQKQTEQASEENETQANGKTDESPPRFLSSRQVTNEDILDDLTGHKVIGVLDDEGIARTDR